MSPILMDADILLESEPKVEVDAIDKGGKNIDQKRYNQVLCGTCIRT